MVSVQDGDKPSFISSDPAKAWCYTLLTVTFINLMAANGAFLQRFTRSPNARRVLLFLMSFAVGVLSANAITALIPTAFGLDGDHAGYIRKSVVILVGLYLFSMVEVIIKIVTARNNGSKMPLFSSSHQHSHEEQHRRMDDKHCQVNHHTVVHIIPDDSGNANNNNNNSNNKVKNNGSSNDTDSKPIGEAIKSHRTDSVVDFECCETGTVDQSNEDDREGTNLMQSHRKLKNNDGRFYSPVCFNNGAVGSLALLIIVGDAIHNFIDGLAMGSTFASSLSTGLSTSLAILAEELPHELGDFAALMTSGMTVWQALFWNLISACSCYVGSIIGLLLGSLENAIVYIEGFCGGIFIYISYVGIFPEVLEESVNLAGNSYRAFLVNIFLVFLGIFCGMAFMVGMSFVTIDINV